MYRIHIHVYREELPIALQPMWVIAFPPIRGLYNNHQKSLDEAILRLVDTL